MSSTILLGWAPAPLGRLDVFFSRPPQVTGFYLIDSLIARDRETFWRALKQLILPALTLAIFSLAPIARMTRASMLAVLSSDFVRTARASGLSAYTVIITYAFRNAMLPVITTLGMVFSFLLGANVLVEKVFAWPGIGSYAVEALIASDFAPVQGFVLTMAVMYVALNLMIDILYGVIDPRVRLEGMSRPAPIAHRRGARAVRRAVPACPLRARRESRSPALRSRLFVLIVLAALFGPHIVPYDPLASDTAAALKPPNAHHWFGTDQLGRDMFSRVVVATRLDFFIAIASVALVFLMGGLGRRRRRLLRRLDRPHRRPHRRHHHGVSAVRAGDGHRRRARQYGAEHRPGDRDRELSALCAGRPRRGQYPPRRRLRGGGAAVRQ